MDYIIYMLAFICIYIALATVLHLQFNVAGIVNFGIVGFWGVGMYVFALLQVKLSLPFVPALLLAAIAAAGVAALLGSVILKLDDQSVLVATLAFASIIEYLVMSESWLTRGVMGLGTVYYPFDLGSSTMTTLVYLLLIAALLALLIIYTAKIKKAPYGRLLQSISDNELLVRSLGKPTFKHKLILFTVTCGVIGLFGALAAPLYNYIFPRMIGSSVTFTIWIALMLGGRKRLFGGFVGILATVGLFDLIIEAVVPIPVAYAQIIPNIKYLIYGLMLMLVLMFRPLGILGDTKKKRKEVKA